MEDKIKFPANVILIDVAFLNEVVYGAKNFLEGKLGRKLPDVDLPAWLSYLALGNTSSRPNLTALFMSL